MEVFHCMGKKFEGKLAAMYGLRFRADFCLLGSRVRVFQGVWAILKIEGRFRGYKLEYGK